MNKSLPITFVIHKSLPIIQSILAKIGKTLAEKSLPSKTRAIN